MKKISIRQWAAATMCMALAGAVMAQEKVTAQTLVERQQILDQITRYYYNFGKAERQSEEGFYAEDGVLILGTRRYEGREGIKSAYNRPPPAPAADGAAPAAPRERLPFNITVDNALIVVHGNTATSQVIFTEYRPEKKGDPMKMTTQGKEYATWVKVKGQWLYKSRQIASGSEPPADWKE
jgi:transcriptional regulator of nitric oxide reductase